MAHGGMVPRWVEVEWWHGGLPRQQQVADDRWYTKPTQTFFFHQKDMSVYHGILPSRFTPDFIIELPYSFPLVSPGLSAAGLLT